ncbi:low affinity immunoglobulin epsilon Fc receptor-like [Dreissena polymorpha]|nr:low affinity immunoglobulin epsilon Fc receptor-like [Dreissena polymorpha]
MIHLYIKTICVVLLAFLSRSLCAVFHKLDSNGEPGFKKISKSLVVENELLCSRACVKTAECDIIAFNTVNHTCIIGSNTTEITFTPSAIGTAWRVYELQCDPPMVKYRHSCYYRSKIGRQWLPSKLECEAMGAHLLVVTDSEENDFIYNVLFRDEPNFQIFIGGFRLMEESTYQWITGEPWTFANWNPLEPSLAVWDTGESEECVCITGQWNWTDIPCNQTRMFVCEF